jgi:hypothetical protein
VALPQSDDPDGEVLRLVPDSGADALVLFGEAAAKRLPLSTRGASRLGSLAGEDGVQSSVVEMLRVGAMTLRDQIAAVVPARTEGEDGDGLLPLHQFGSVFFNNRDGYLLIEPR